MTSAFLFVTLLAQSQFPDGFPQRRLTAPEDLQQVVGFAGASRDESDKRASVYQQYRFTTSFNHLKKALDEFADAYNQGTLDLKKIEEVKKAWRDLENSEARFRLQKSK
jgi:hypothetical protein